MIRLKIIMNLYTKNPSIYQQLNVINIKKDIHYDQVVLIPETQN